MLVVDFNRKKHVKLFHADKLDPLGKVSVYNCRICGYKVANEYYFYEHKFKCVKPKTKKEDPASTADQVQNDKKKRGGPGQGP